VSTLEYLEAILRCQQTTLKSRSLEEHHFYTQAELHRGRVLQSSLAYLLAKLKWKGRRRDAAVSKTMEDMINDYEMVKTRRLLLQLELMQALLYFIVITYLVRHDRRAGWTL
jgi:hypothetical protein